MGVNELITQRSEVQILPRNSGRLNMPPFLLALRGIALPYSESPLLFLFSVLRTVENRSPKITRSRQSAPRLSC